jgi:hypothetical protein
MSYSPYQRAVMSESTRELADKLFDIIRAEDVQLALGAMGMTILRVVMEATPKPGVTRQKVVENWIDQLRRSAARID